MTNTCNITTSHDDSVANATHLDHVLLQLSVIDWCGRDEFILFIDELVAKTKSALNLSTINIHIFTDTLVDVVKLLPQYIATVDSLAHLSNAELSQLNPHASNSQLTNKQCYFSSDNNGFKLIVPLFNRDKYIGAVEFYSGLDSCYSADMVTSFGRAITALLQRNLRLLDNELQCALSMATANKSEEQFHSLAFFDVLTGLANRRLLNQKIETQYELAKNTQVVGALLFIDLDYFKAINDSLGHAVGDVILVEVAQRLREIQREQDFISRLGGDEFVILLPELSENPMHAEQHVNLLAERLIERVSEPYSYNGQALHIGASIGVTLFPSKNQEAHDLLKQADTAMYQAKSNGRKKVAFFDVKMQRKADKRLHIYNCLRSAIEKHELFLHYQPQHMVQSGEIIGVEALVRWHLDGKQLISPAEFIPIAEDTDLIIDIGIWVLQAACRQFVEWQAQGVDVPQISVNVSTRQFHDDNFVDSVLMVLDETGMDPMQLNLEITESVVLEHAEDAVRK